ncbi:MAG TPA: HAD family hydrolase [Bryobacterales bacterium]|nr:HAD family hydrolase [Bryobacterales bacterium]
MVSQIEVLNPEANASRAKVALFDFDGTISLIRAGWFDVMVPMMVEPLLELKSGESEQELTAIVEEFVGQLTGRQTIYQMIEFAEQLKKRGAKPLDPVEYKHQYLALLSEHIKGRIAALESGATDPDEMIVPGGRRLLDTLKQRGFTMYLASGTDQPFMRAEAKLLGVDGYFDGGMFGALDDYKSFSKKILIAKIIEESEYEGEEFLGFGDGFVEIQNVKEVGGVAVGVATDEPACEKVDPVKRQRLAGVGADWIVPNFNAHDELVGTLFPQGR